MTRVGPQDNHPHKHQIVAFNDMIHACVVLCAFKSIVLPLLLSDPLAFEARVTTMFTLKGHIRPLQIGIVGDSTGI